MTVTAGQVDVAARALFERDCRRSIGLAAADYVWPRVAPEYRRAAQAALEAATSDFPAPDEAPDPAVPSPAGEGRLL